MHPAGLAGGQGDFAPLIIAFSLEGKRLAGFFSVAITGLSAFFSTRTLT
jgi:hypothetical protein